MNTQQKAIPKTQAPDLNVSLLNGEQWSLKNQKPEFFTMVVFYRGLHCPLCKKYLEKLNEIVSDLNTKGVDIIAVSMDPEVRARKSKMDWNIDNVTLGYGLDAQSAAKWGLYLSESISASETPLFSEPGLFLVKPDNEIYYANISSNPWGRPFLQSFVPLMDFLKNSGYPARGEVK
ncbi:peroxiredoxin-like family protein [Psychroserpens sp. S379A]|uniref:peroxiredoxin-like family protein n=1 Tax=Psychroserpens sp. S379A TaxID=3415137 RepID=UPI003C7E54E7